MISFLTGVVHAVSAQGAVIAVGGIGVELQTTSRCHAGLQVGQEATVPTSLVVREDQWTMYGFVDDDERACFQALQQAKGIGPRVAVNLLGALTPDQLRRAVAAGDAAALTVAPGIGAKGAQRLVIDLRDRLGSERAATATPGAVPTAEPANGWHRDVHLALLGLGWTAQDASAAIARVEPQAGEAPEPGRLLRLALQTLDRQGSAQ